MGYKVSEIINRIEDSFPVSLAMDWDNPGLICGHGDKEVETILIALDADLLNIDRAVRSGADMIISHHPMIFSAIKKVNDLEPVGRKLLKLIENNISCYAMHTNFDIGRGGMADIVAKRLGVENIRPIEITGEDEVGSLGIGFAAEFSDTDGLTAWELSALLKERFSLERVWYYDSGRPIKRIAVCPGSGKGMMTEVLSLGVDAYITGDTGHHDGLDYKDAGVTLIDAGHYGLEHVFIDEMSEFISNKFPLLKIVKGAEDEREFV